MNSGMSNQASTTPSRAKQKQQKESLDDIETATSFIYNSNRYSISRFLVDRECITSAYGIIDNPYKADPREKAHKVVSNFEIRFIPQENKQ